MTYRKKNDEPSITDYTNHVTFIGMHAGTLGHPIGIIMSLLGISLVGHTRATTNYVSSSSGFDLLYY